MTGLNLLTRTLPANLYPLTYLLPSGLLFINANLGNTIFDYKNQIEHDIADVPHAVRTYPGSAATAMMPLTPANNWTATLVFCGGTNLQPDQWTLVRAPDLAFMVRAGLMGSLPDVEHRCLPR